MYVSLKLKLANPTAYPDLFFARLDTGTIAILEHSHNTWQTLHQRDGVLDIPLALSLCDPSPI